MLERTSNPTHCANPRYHQLGKCLDDLWLACFHKKNRLAHSKGCNGAGRWELHIARSRLFEIADRPAHTLGRAPVELDKRRQQACKVAYAYV